VLGRAQEGGGGLVGLFNRAVGVGDQIAHGRQVKELLVTPALNLQRSPRGQQLLVLLAVLLFGNLQFFIGLLKLGGALYGVFLKRRPVAVLCGPAHCLASLVQELGHTGQTMDGDRFLILKGSAQDGFRLCQPLFQ